MKSELIEKLNFLHFRYKSGSNIPRDRWNERVTDIEARYKAYAEFGKLYSDRLPFEWEIIGAANCSNNHNGNRHGSDHIVLKQDFKKGRITRSKEQPLCNGSFKDLWVEPSEYTIGASCKKCLELAIKLTK